MMRPVTELVDKFIEDLATGVIQSTYTEIHAKLTTKGKQSVQGLLDGLKEYREETDTVLKLKHANYALYGILYHRTLGIFVNNPRQEQLELLRTQNEVLKGENADLKGQVEGCMATIKKLRAEVAGKGGVA
jgi:hypothetical protein